MNSNMSKNTVNKATRLTIAGFISLATCAIHAQTLVFDHVDVIPMDQEGVLSDMRVIVRDEKIFRIEPSAAPLDIAVDKTIDASGQFMVPGFSDTHFHPSPKPEENELLNYLLVAN